MTRGLRPQLPPPPSCKILSLRRILFNYLLEIDVYTGHHDEPLFQLIIKILRARFYAREQLV
jgi:hypothetical protein